MVVVIVEVVVIGEVDFVKIQVILKVNIVQRDDITVICRYVS